MAITEKITHLLENHHNIHHNISRTDLIRHVIDNKKASLALCGAVVNWTEPTSTGRSPKDTYVVAHEESKDTIDWTSPNNIPLAPELFDQLYNDALDIMAQKPEIYVSERVIGADSSYCLPSRLITDRALSVLFTDNMFRPTPADVESSMFFNDQFTLLALPYDKIQTEKYEGLLRKLPNGNTSDMIIAMDMDRKIGLVYGSSYCGSLKKMLFTVMNYMLPAKGILPLHCSANEGEQGDCAVFLGLSGTGKTTLSSDPKRKLLGDDEHGWSDSGIANFENGCYAKLIDLKKEKEPEIYNAVFTNRNYLENGVIIENAMMYPDGHFDLTDDRLTANSRASYPLDFLTNIKPESTSTHPSTIIFLTADANGVLPPVAKLTPAQAMLWFLMGYTSKLAGTETGVTEPVSTFSRFFGEPFMPRNPEDYTSLLGKKMEEHGTSVYLVNTGWSGGPYGVGSRMDITMTRSIIDAALNGSLKDVEYEENPLFHIMMPKSCPNVEGNVLNPRNTWTDQAAYDERAQKLASEFAAHFDKAYGNSNLGEDIRSQCPGK